MAVELSHAINLFLHKDRASFFDDDTVISGSVAPLEPRPVLATPSSDWDMQTTCKPMLPAIQYISRKLLERDLSVALIVSNHEPYVIPIWPLPITSQIILAKIVRKARSKFHLIPHFLTAVASHTNKKVLHKIHNTHRPDSYIVRRSILQHEVIFRDEGLTLLTVDHIYTFKQLLSSLSRKDWVPCARDVCLSSCVHLYHRINQIYTNPRVSKGYIARVYKEIEFQKEAYEEVCSAYNVNFCTASIKDVTTLEPDFSVLADVGLEWDASRPGTASAAELPEASTCDAPNSSEDLISPIATMDVSTLQTWEPKYPHSAEILSPLTYTYPSIERPSGVPKLPLDSHRPMATSMLQPLITKPSALLETILSPPNQTDPQAWDAGLSRPLSPKATRNSDLSLSPLDQAVAEAWETDFPLPPVRVDAEAWNLDEEATKEIIKQWICDVPAPLKTVESESSDRGKSTLEYVKAWVESWSTFAPDRVCAKCQDVVRVPRRVTVA